MIKKVPEVGLYFISMCEHLFIHRKLIAPFSHIISPRPLCRVQINHRQPGHRTRPAADGRRRIGGRLRGDRQAADGQGTDGGAVSRAVPGRPQDNAPAQGEGGQNGRAGPPDAPLGRAVQRRRRCGAPVLRLLSVIVAGRRRGAVPAGRRWGAGAVPARSDHAHAAARTVFAVSG